MQRLQWREGHTQKGTAALAGQRPGGPCKGIVRIMPSQKGILGLLKKAMIASQHLRNGSLGLGKKEGKSGFGNDNLR